LDIDKKSAHYQKRYTVDSIFSFGNKIEEKLILKLLKH